MKTQLLEDIGQNATLSPAPPRQAGQPGANKPLQQPAKETSLSAGQPDEQAAPVDLDSVFEEIAALEAQYVPPAQHQEPVPAPPEVQPDLQPEPRHDPAPAVAMDAIRPEPTIPRAPVFAPQRDPAPDPDPAHGRTIPQDPVFDFTLPTPQAQAAEPFTPSHSWPTPSRQRRSLWTAAALVAALLAGGGWWAYQEYRDVGSLAFLASQSQEMRQDSTAADRTASAATQPAPAAAMPERARAPEVPPPEVPPLVMLPPEPPAALKTEQSPSSPPEQAAPALAPEPASQAAPEPEAVAEQRSVFPLPKSLSQASGEQSDAAAEPAPRKSKPKREPVRQLARVSAIEPEKPLAGEGAMSALLRACREHGYHAAQCVKRGCSLTQYGFACRGR
ncbi:hypothetical protein [Massilia suwonensis]|uniref:Uncharacterized protein n=1 Tax=Massilia suwonensis TaxID=648895 RepID=A0ABW0MRN0_9BURK